MHSRFGRAAGIAGLTTGIVSIASVVHVGLTGEFSPLVVAASLLTIVWLIVVGRGLLRPLRSVEMGDR